MEQQILVKKEQHSQSQFSVQDSNPVKLQNEGMIHLDKTFNSLKLQSGNQSISKNLYKFEQESWLLQLIQLNQNKYIQIVKCITNISNLITNQQLDQQVSINHLKYAQLKEKKHLIIVIERLNQYHYLMKIRRKDGFIVEHRIGKLQDSKRDLLRIVKMVGDRIYVYIYHKLGDMDFIRYIIRQNYKSIVVIVQEDIQEQFKNILYYSVKQLNQIRLLIPNKIIKKLWQTPKNIVHLIEQFQGNDKINVNCFFSQFYPAYQACQPNPQIFCLISNFLRDMIPFQLKRMQYILKIGLESVSSQVKKWQLSTNSHMPKKGKNEKVLCNFCHKKKTEVVCGGCSSIDEKEVYLCIGNCFANHHEFHNKFTKRSNIQILKNMNYFDKKGQEIIELMTKLIQLKHPLLIQTTNFICSKIMNYSIEIANIKNNQEEQQDQ